MSNSLLKWLKFNAQYLTHTPWDTGFTPPEVIRFINQNPPGRVLDLGAGSGTNIITLAKAGWDAVGVEFALLAVVSAKKKIRRAGVNARIFLRDVINLDFLRGTFNLVLDIGCYHSLDLSERLLYQKNLKRLLKTGGTFLIYAFLYDESESRIGINQSDIELFSMKLKLISSVEGKEREQRNSIWLEYRNE
jgi:SAM-dependent methyltransferase